LYTATRGHTGEGYGPVVATHCLCVAGDGIP